jgi:pimeloyl-ACP methyl ester carboxylesterase
MDDHTIGAWLDHRHRALSSPRRAAATIDELARRRQEMNQRLPVEWLRYLVPIGARRDPDGWRWKLDPFIAPGAFAPSRVDRWAERMRDLEQPFLGLKAGIQEERGWGGHVHPKYIEPYLPAKGRIEFFEDAGHFIHSELPDEVARLILDFLA